jgi:osmotically inducible protein OsmC
MPTRTADAEWQGNLVEGKGHISLGSGAFDGPYDWRSRSADGAGTNPEELIAAAHAGCFSMALSAVLTEGGHVPTSIHTTARVRLDKVEGGFAITRIDLATEATIPGISAEQFEQAAQGAKAGCPVSKALAGTEIHLTATLSNG